MLPDYSRLTEEIVAIARDEHSQHKNRKRVPERLSAQVAYHEKKIMETARRERWQLHNELIRGNPVRVNCTPQVGQNMLE